MSLMKSYRFLGVFLLGVMTVAAMVHTWRGNLQAELAFSGQHQIRIGTNRALGTVIPYVAQEKSFFQEQHIQARVVDFNDVTTLMEAFSSGQTDVAMVGIAPSAIWQAKGLALKIVASANGGGHILMTRADTGIDTLSDLRGRKVATPKPGTVTDTLFRSHLMHDIAGLDADKDIQILPDMAAADMPTVLFVSREVDAAITWEPFASQAEAKFRNARILYDASAEWRRQHPNMHQLYPVNVAIARQDFIDKHAEDLRRFLAAHVEAVHFMNEHPDEANQIISKIIQLDPAIVVAARKRIDYTSAVDIDASLQTLQWSHHLGYLTSVPTAEKLFDLSFLPKGERQ